MKIIGIDDNQELLDLCEIALTSAGHEYTGCDNGKDGLELIRKQQFDIVLLDLSMPEFCGVDVLNDLERDGIANKLKIIVFTATNPSKEESSSLLKKGVDSILKKPLDIDMLMGYIDKMSSE